MASDDDFVPISGVVHLRTSLGIFLAVDGLRVFIPANLRRHRLEFSSPQRP